MRRLSILGLLFVGCASFHDYVGHGIPNLAVVDAYITRGGEPTAAGCQWLKVSGYTKWIKLSYEYEGESKTCEALGIKVLHYEMPPSDARDFVERPKHEVVAGAVNALLACRANHEKCFFGCLHGRDRTGLIAALYRYLTGELSRNEAWTEAKAHGLRTFFHELSDVYEDWRP